MSVSAFVSDLSRTALSLTDPFARLHFNIESRIRSVSWHLRTVPSMCPNDALSSSGSARRLRNVIRAERSLEVLRGFLSRLDRYHTMDTLSEVRREFLAFGTLEDHLNDVFGEGCWYPRTGMKLHPVVDAILEKVAVSQSLCRAATWRFRVRQESVSCKDWYPVFNTLTVDNHEYSNVFTVGSRLFRDHIRSLQRAACRALYGRGCAPDGVVPSDYFRYIAVTEYGEQTGRSHIHYLCFFRKFPFGDPNDGRSVPDHREIPAIRSLWPYGFSSPVACRFGRDDSYGLLGWRWPLLKPGQVISTVDKLCNYVSKYILKSYVSESGVHLPWRTRCSRGFGTHLISQTLSGMALHPLMALYTSPTLMDGDKPAVPGVSSLIPDPDLHRFRGVRLPKTFLRKLILIEIVRLLHRSVSGKSKLRKSIPSQRRLPSLVEQFTTTIRTMQAPSWPITGYTPTASFVRSAIFEFFGRYNRVLCP